MRHSSYRRHDLTKALALGAALLLTEARAAAQSDPAAASSLFSEGRKLAAQKKYSEACPKFEESQRLDPGIGTQFNLADCWEQIGRTASAWALYQDVASAAKASGQRDREKVARQRAERLAPKLSHLKLIVQADHPGLAITRDGIALGTAVWNTEVPVDPGTHRLEATAPGHEPWNRTIDVGAESATATVTVPPLERSAKAPAAPATSLAAAAGPELDRGPTGGGSRKTLGFVVGGAGVVGLLAGGFFGLKTLAKNNDAKEVCADRPNACPLAEQREHASLVDDAKSARTISIVGFAAGGAALGAGLVLIFTAPKSEASNAQPLRLTPMLGAGSAGASLGGTF